MDKHLIFWTEYLHWISEFSLNLWILTEYLKKYTEYLNIHWISEFSLIFWIFTNFLKKIYWILTGYRNIYWISALNHLNICTNFLHWIYEYSLNICKYSPNIWIFVLLTPLSEAKNANFICSGSFPTGRSNWIFFLIYWEAIASRYNGGPIEASPWTPRYHSAVVWM